MEREKNKTKAKPIGLASGRRGPCGRPGLSPGQVGMPYIGGTDSARYPSDIFTKPFL